MDEYQQAQRLITRIIAYKLSQLNKADLFCQWKIIRRTMEVHWLLKC
jgi:hypothetical protein